MKASRVFQLTALALLAVSAVQVGWWLFDQRAYTLEKVRAARVLYAGQARAAQALLAAGVSETRVRELLPDVEIAAGQAALAPAVEAALRGEEARRYRQYAWEGAFFLLALAACIAVIARALRAEARVLEEQDDFLALVSHQFKTPLASLQLSLETMALRPLAPEQSRTLIERMLADLARMEMMVTQILESVRLERGRVDLRSEPVELAGALARVVGALEERARGQRIALTSDVAPGLSVLTDPLALDVIVRNVLENALAAVAAVGGGSVAVSARAGDGEVALAVRDSGVGFRPADGARLFEKFSRLHPGGGSGHYGTGLGLYIVKRLMHLAHGRV
ncbi:MAG TPA: HAMP domain-containing sensor histidine kinase, partial [Steroidobacteraceae bacterium]|nr:HAMP domain-containing sensor histidine kinase [Steroidobacteraceae bacterium]